MSKFDNLAKEWDMEQRRLDRAKFVADRILKLSKTRRKCLDFGAGTGLLGYNFVDTFEEVSFYDTSIGMKEVLKEKAKGKKNVNILDELDGTYDMIINQMVMHHIKDHKEIINKFYKLLNKNSEIFIVDLFEEDGSFHKNEEGIFHFGIDPYKLGEMMEVEGFEGIHIEKIYTIEKNNKEYDLFLLKGEKK